MAAAAVQNSSPVPGQYDYSKLKPYVHPPETKEKLDWAELVTLDMEDFQRPGGKERLAKQLQHAVHHVGFFYVKNFGIPQEEVDRQFVLAKNFFELPTEEKEKYEADYASADYNGWRRIGRVKTGNTYDKTEMYNIPKFTPYYVEKYKHPPLLTAHIDEIEKFHKTMHSNIVTPLLKLFAIILELEDEDYLVKLHTYDGNSEDNMRYMLYHPRTPEEWEAAEYGINDAHTDLGTLTLLFRQPVAGLQILSEDGKWYWVSPQPGTITVNLADTLSHLTGGWLKSSVHRVYAPPMDQRHLLRTGLLYLARANNDTKLIPVPSPLLAKAGVTKQFNKVITMGELARAKNHLTLNPGVAAARAAQSADGTVEIVAGYKESGVAGFVKK